MRISNTRRGSYAIFTILISLSIFFAEVSHAQQRSLPADTVINSTDELTIKGEQVPHRVFIGTQPVLSKDGKPDAALFYTYYERTDMEDDEHRLIFISFNGGPGAASLWMHLGYTSPKRLKISDKGYPVQPYGIEDNPHSILDVAD